jgi:hypothetical protein
MTKDEYSKRLFREKFLFIETVVRNKKGTVLYHGTELIPEFHEDYNITIDKYGLGIKYYKPTKPIKKK